MEILLTAIGIIFLLLIIIFAVKYIISAILNNKIAAYQNDTMQKYYQEVENMYLQVRRWRHDYKHHIQTMKAHLFMKQYEELELYLNELDKDLSSLDTVIKTGNVRIDAILNSKLGIANSKNISVNVKAIVPVSLPFPETELCAVIGNLLDNAIEACLKEPDTKKRFIRVYIDILKNHLYIYVANSTNNNIRKIGRTYISTKTGGHGFGIMSIDKVVKRYNGYIKRAHEEDVFATEIMLNL